MRYVDAALLSLLVAGPFAGTAVADVLPGTPRGRVAVSSEVSLDAGARATAERCLASSEVGAEYRAAFVATTDVPGDRSTRRGDAVPVAEALFQRWTGAGALDVDTGVVIVVALEDRAVAVQPGETWGAAGFETRAVTRVIDGSQFGRQARAGRYGDAVCELVAAIEEDLGRRLDASEPAAVAVAPSPAPPPPSSNARPAPSTEATTDAATDEETQPNETREPKDDGPKTPAEKAGYACGTVIGWGIVIAFFALLLGIPTAVAWWLWRKLRDFLTRDRRRAEAEIATWREKLRAAADRLLALEKEHPLYFAVDTRRYEGESAALDRRAADAVNRSFLLYSRAEELVDQADTFVQAKDAEEAWRLLREAEIAWDQGVPPDDEDRRRIFVPLEREYRGVATELLDDLQAAYAEAVDALDEVARVEAANRDRLERLEEASAAALAAAVRRAELGLPAEVLHEVLDPCLDRRRRLEARAATDPLGAGADLDACAADLEAFIERAAEGNAMLEEMQGPITELGQTLRARLESLRAAGRTVEEPGFDPDLRLDRGAQQAVAIEAALVAGRDREAGEALARLRDGLEELDAQLQVIADAPQTLGPALAALDDRVRALRDRLPEAREHLERLARHHAAESFAEESEALDALLERLDELDRWRTGVDEAIAAEHYLAASEDLATGERLAASGEALVDAVAEHRLELEAARESGLGSVTALEAHLRSLGDAASAAGVAAADRRRLDDLVASADELFAEARADRPHWARLAPQLDADLREAERLDAALRADRDAWAEAETRADALAAEIDALRRRVAVEDRDRPAVERSVDHAAGRLDAWRSLDDAHGGRARRERLVEVADALAAAEASFRREMDAVREAEQAIGAAVSEIQREDGRGHGHGVTSDCRAARSLLSEAQSAARSRRWEDALERARRAGEEAREEARRARDEARRREEEERRRLERIEAEEAARRRARALENSLDAAIGAARIASAVLGSSRSSIGRRGPVFRAPRPTSRPKFGGGGSSWGGSGGGSRW